MRLIDDMYLGDFSKLANPKPKDIKKLFNMDPSSLYYIGLYALESNNDQYKDDAAKYFEYAVKYSPHPYNKLADEELYKLLPDNEKIEKLKDELSKNDTSEEKKQELKSELQNLLFLSEKFDEMEIPLAEYLSRQKFTNEIAKILKKLRSVSANRIFNFSEDLVKINEARLLSFSSVFKDSWLVFRPFLEKVEDYPYLENRMILSDMGKAALSGSADYAHDVLLFENRLDHLEKKSKLKTDYNMQKYMYAFYAARMRLKIGGKKNISAAIELFKKAQSYAHIFSDYDTALWYVLEIQKNRSFSVFLDELCASVTNWKNPAIYEDLVSYACMKLVFTKDWKGLETLHRAIQRTSLVSAQARHSYILARSMNFSEEKKISEEKSKKMYLEVYGKDHNFFYYRIMAAYYLDLPLMMSTYSKKYTRKSTIKFSPEDSLDILKGFIEYKLYSKLYDKVLLLYPQIKIKDAAWISEILAQNSYYSDSMKIMTFAVNSANNKFDVEHLKLIYPQPWLESVKKYSAEYNLPEYLVYALLRSESYFKAKVVSHAGAIGLAQLMSPTAADIARRLKLKNYDLNDPDTNIRFGTFYLSDMIKRNKGNIMHALFSYNAGPNAVKRWLKQSGNLPDDLFLESLAYGETRGYGRNVLTAAVIYGILYYNKDYREIVKELFLNIKE